MFVIELSAQCQAQRGYNEGLSLPAVVFGCKLVLHGAVDLSKLWPALEQYFGLSALSEQDSLATLKNKVNNTLITPKSSNAEAILGLASRLALKFMQNALLPMPNEFVVLAQQQRWQVFLPYIRHEASIIAFSMAVDALNASAQLGANSKAIQAGIQLGRIQRAIGLRLEPFQEPGQNRRYFIQAALKNSVPWVRNGASYLTFGNGQFARRMASTFTDDVSPIAAGIAKDKAQSAKLLRQCGLPGADNRDVRSATHLLELAKLMGYPLVIKPANLDQGTGVFADINNEAVLLWAYREALKHSNNILLERHVDGHVYRFTLYNGVAASITKKLPGGVMGDGKMSIAELLVSGVCVSESLGLEASDAYKKPLVLDEEALNLLAQKGLTPQSVLAAKQFVPLRRKTNAFAGGITSPVDAASVHPDNLAVAGEAALRCGVDVAGVDLIISDISQSWRHTTALICEVNAQPQVGPEAAEKILLWHLAKGVRIAVDVLLTDTPEQITETQLSAYGRHFGHHTISNITGLICQNKFLGGPFNSGFDAARVALQDNRVSSLLCVISSAELSLHGLPIDVVRNIYTLTNMSRIPHKSPDKHNLKSKLQAHVTGHWLPLDSAIWPLTIWPLIKEQNR